MAHIIKAAAADYIILLTLVIKAHQKNYCGNIPIYQVGRTNLQNYTKHSNIKILILYKFFDMRYRLQIFSCEEFNLF